MVEFNRNLLPHQSYVVEYHRTNRWMVCEGVAVGGWGGRWQRTDCQGTPHTAEHAEVKEWLRNEEHILYRLIKTYVSGRTCSLTIRP